MNQARTMNQSIAWTRTEWLNQPHTDRAVNRIYIYIYFCFVSPAVTLTWHASKHIVHELHQRYSLKKGCHPKIYKIYPPFQVHFGYTRWRWCVTDRTQFLDLETGSAPWTHINIIYTHINLHVGLRGNRFNLKQNGVHSARVVSTSMGVNKRSKDVTGT